MLHLKIGLLGNIRLIIFVWGVRRNFKMHIKKKEFVLRDVTFNERLLDLWDIFWQKKGMLRFQDDFYFYQLDLS